MATLNFFRRHRHVRTVGQNIDRIQQLLCGLMGVDVGRYIRCLVPDDLFHHGLGQPVIAGHGDEGMPGVMGDVPVEVLPVESVNIDQVSGLQQVPVLVRHDQVGVVDEQADVIEVLDERKDTVCDRDHPVLAGGGFFPSDHVAPRQMHIFHTHASQFCLPEAGISLDQDDLVELVVTVGPQPAQLFRSEWLMFLRFFFRSA